MSLQEKSAYTRGYEAGYDHANFETFYGKDPDWVLTFPADIEGTYLEGYYRTGFQEGVNEYGQDEDDDLYDTDYDYLMDGYDDE